MICFLTSRADVPGAGTLNPANRFIEELRRVFPDPCRALFVCSDPDALERTDQSSSITKEFFENSGFGFVSFAVLDGRNRERVAELVGSSDLIILAGGNTSTQNRFFNEVGLGDLMKNFNGVVVGISAGSMNSADVVYACPERSDEATYPAYQRFQPGLGLTKTMLLPHYEDVKEFSLDVRLIEAIKCLDSIGRTFYAIPDGSYLYVGEEGEELRGEAYMIKEGEISRISSDGGTVRLR